MATMKDARISRHIKGAVEEPGTAQQYQALVEAFKNAVLCSPRDAEKHLAKVGEIAGKLDQESVKRATEEASVLAVVDSQMLA